MAENGADAGPQGAKTAPARARAASRVEGLASLFAVAAFWAALLAYAWLQRPHLRGLWEGFAILR